MADEPHAPARPLIVVMGVSGCGKTTVGQRLARALGIVFADGDDLHPEANIAKMRAGVALSDADRVPWLDRVAAWAGAHRESGGVISCSALKRVYRDRVRADAPEVVFAHLTADRHVLEERIRSRRGHFMPAALLDSQLDALEPLGADETGLTLDATLAPERLVALVTDATR